MSDQRFSPSIKVDHARKFCEVTALIQQGRTDEAWAKFNEYLVDFGNLGGAFNAQLPKDNEVIVLPKYDPASDVGGRFFDAKPGFTYKMDFSGPGRVAGSTPDGIQHLLGLDGEFVTMGNGATLIHADAGPRNVVFKLADGMTACKANIFIGTV